MVHKGCPGGGGGGPFMMIQVVPLSVGGPINSLQLDTTNLCMIP